jgi:hypothetical protein
MKYALLIYQDADFERYWADADDQQKQELYARYTAFGNMLAERNAVVDGNELGLSHTATTVRTKDGGDAVVTDGPFAEVAEQLGGYYIVNAADLDEALEFARALPNDVVEVRPVIEYEHAAAEERQQEGVA